jgi:hypothetical protein
MMQFSGYTPTPLPQPLATTDSPTFAALSLGTGELTAGSINRTAGAFTIEIGGTSVIDVASTSVKFNQNVGIKKAPSYALDVDGDINLDGLSDTFKVGGYTQFRFDNKCLRIGYSAGLGITTNPGSGSFFLGDFAGF